MPARGGLTNLCQQRGEARRCSRRTHPAGMPRHGAVKTFAIEILTIGLDMRLPGRYRHAFEYPLNRWSEGMNDKSKNLEAALTKIVHDLRTPLAVVHTTSNMLLNPKYKLTETQVREQHERIQRNAEILSRLVGELSELAKPAKADDA